MIIILSKRYKYLNIFGLLHLIHEKSASNNFQNNKNYYLTFNQMNYPNFFRLYFHSKIKCFIRF